MKKIQKLLLLLLMMAMLLPTFAMAETPVAVSYTHLTLPTTSRV